MASKKMSVRKRPQYDDEFKAEAVRLMQLGGKPVADLAAELGVSEQSLYRWSSQAKIDKEADPQGPLTSAERAEIVALRRQLKNVEQERDFLKKTAAYFASSKRRGSL